jgi:hypothetical protein
MAQSTELRRAPAASPSSLAHPHVGIDPLPTRFKISNFNAEPGMMADRVQIHGESARNTGRDSWWVTA